MNQQPAQNDIDWNVVDETRRSSLEFPVVGIGASAGGMAAALQLFERMPDEPGMAFVVVLHLSPEHESHAASILQRATRMPVMQVSQTGPIEINHVYVIAPALHLTMDDGKLVVEKLDRPRGRPVAIDLFFRTLAQAHRERAIAVVLSGTGSDGALGLGEVKAQGGISLVQAPTDAEYAGMPRAAIATGRVDFVLSAAEIPAKLIELWQNARAIELPHAAEAGLQAREPTEAAAARADAALDDVIAILASRTGNDFRNYKRGTVVRRLERRMQVTRQQNLAAYRQYLEAHPQETAHLLQDMLISVTSFCRDADAFEALEREVSHGLFQQLPAGAPLRAWVVGCATGEEAYSVAMVLNESAPEMVPRPSIQIFASDIDDRALAMARAGVYPEGIAADVSGARLRQFFDYDGGTYKVKKALREQILFARHNVLRDPPFSRLHLIACRNLLIYLERDLQAEVLEMFHFALNPGGLLFLGSAESADSLPEHFTVVDKKRRIYRANAVRLRRGDVLPLRSGAFPAPGGTAERPLPSVAGLTVLHQRLLDDCDRATVVIDANHKIMHTNPGAARYLRHVPGVPSQDLLVVVLPELALALRPAVLLAAHSGRRVAAKPVTIDGEQGRITLQMTAYGSHDASRSGYMLIAFDEVDATLYPSAETGPGALDPAYAVLEAEVLRLQRELQGTVGESASSGEALRASNEELQSMNEELRSATEELETSKEELQSVNEELTTVNFELKHKVEETAKVNDDLNNLITSMNIATLFVDRRMLIKGFTPQSSKVFNVLATDMGRPLSDITHHLDYADSFATDVRHVLATLQPVEREVASIDGRWYLMRVSAYRTNEDRIDGAVLNFIDVTERRAAQEQVRARDERLRLVAESTKDFAVITLDAAGRVTGWNKGAELMFGYTVDEVVGEHFRRLFVPEDRAAGAPEQELQAARESGRALDERWHLRKDGSRFYCSGITTPLVEGNIEGFAKIARDLTERRLLERQREDLLDAEKVVRAQLEAAHALRNEFLAVMSHELKNPLNLIMMSAELIGRSPEVQAVPRLSRTVDTIRRAIQGQSQIIDDLLDLSRLQTGKLTLSRSAVKWRPIIERIADALRTDAQAKQLSLTVETEDLAIFADVVRVEQIFWNLASNALKFTPPGGSVHVRLTRDGPWALLEVQDTGRGIEPGFLDRVFDMFQQADHNPSTRREGGLGIGLALVKSLAELHGGSVQAESKGPGQGAVFRVRLPLLEGALSDDRPDFQLVSRQALNGRRILLVDDDVATLETLGELLTAEGAKVTTAMSAYAAWEQAQNGNFDLLVSDIGMPGMDGLELITRLRQLPKAAHWPAIAVTGFGRPEDAQKSRAAGFDLHLTKPVSLDTLSEALVRLAKLGRS
ncbi:Autoinducer 2 sensor kinase/phosphatase LuxQ [Variovorax sp. PBL-H6]|uniref:CheR family methyltransferase n=1 Tax=Variovorax sp. PBL-H6 TaxID=434009 RepID=UPI001317AA5E|nr:CheR family methyltransferase [Variovorax sp. PBL-H6]VTU21307.1 Autoinducer 2 sensor kinase/phosphatase LuxQ [Variovorax sp. PBL-H6]